MGEVMFYVYSSLLKGAPDCLKVAVLDTAAEDPDISVVDFLKLQAIAYPDQVKIIFL